MTINTITCINRGVFGDNFSSSVMQFDSLIEYLTGRELLTMFARIRGVPEDQIKEVVENEITRLDLSMHADKRCGKYR